VFEKARKRSSEISILNLSNIEVDDAVRNSFSFAKHIVSKNNSGLRVISAAESQYIFPSRSTCYKLHTGGGIRGRGRGGWNAKINVPVPVHAAPGSSLNLKSSFQSLLTSNGYIHECRRCFNKVRLFYFVSETFIYIFYLMCHSLKFKAGPRTLMLLICHWNMIPALKTIALLLLKSGPKLQFHQGKKKRQGS
jgi:hypothetical protein